MLFGAFNVIVWRPCHPGDHIDCIISRCPSIHGTLHIWSEALSCTAASTVGCHCACGGVFVVRSVVDDDTADTIQSLFRLRRRLCHPLRRRWRRRYEFIHFAPAAASLSFAPSLMMTNDTNSFNLRLQMRLCRSLRRQWRRTMRIHSCWKPTWSSFRRIAAVGRSTPIAIDSLTLIVLCSSLVIHRAFTIFLSDVPPYASLWVW